MVQSGLEDSQLLYVSHYKLAIHFVFALGLLCYTLWFALQLLISVQQLTINRSLRRFTGWLIAVLTLQLIYGAFMAGLKAATAAPTWPTINRVWWPQNLHSYGDHYFPGISFLYDHPLMVHFIHRNLAYIITALVIIWTWKAYRLPGTGLFKKTRGLPLFIVLVQVILGILTVLNSVNTDKFLWLAVAHQFVAMLLLLSLFFMAYITRTRKNVNE
jgi:cytochrome c oxidase assembly protein subunit 15